MGVSRTRPSRKSEHAPAGKRFSVIVPVYEHWSLVPALIKRLRRQTFPSHAFEAILVDNGSADILLPKDLPAWATVLHCDAPGSYAARNVGARHAHGEWLVFTDADCLPSSNWLRAFGKAADDCSAPTLLAGQVEMVASSSSPNIYEIYDLVKGIPQSRYVRRGYAATANLAVPRRIFEELGGFDDKRLSGGDAEFCRRAGAQGYPIRYVPQASVEHSARSTWPEIATKARRVKGGQLTAGTPRGRHIWTLATLAPPARGAWIFLANTDRPLGDRLLAILVLLRVWLVEVKELARLKLGGEPERR